MITENIKMKNKEIISVIVISSLVFLFAGCQRGQEKALEDLKAQAEQNESVSKRFQGANTANGTTIDSAMKIAQDYAALSQKYSDLQQKNLELTEENSKLKERLTVLQPELIQTKKELEEANNLLVDMRIELNNWKTDIIGFRDEMRAADKVQLETLIKILKTLGGEFDSSDSQLSDVNINSQMGESNEKN